MGRNRHRSDSVTVNGTQSPPLSIDRPLATMTLSTDTVVKSTDIINVTKVFHLNWVHLAPRRSSKKIKFFLI